MKKIICTLTVFLLITIPLLAQTGEMRVVPTAKPSVFKLYYTADIESDIKITVRNSGNESVFTRKIKNKKGFILPIDFSEFLTDNYQIELFTPLFILNDSVNYTSVTDRFRENFEWEHYAEKNKVIVTALNPMDDEITVLINDNNNNEIDKQQIPGDRFGVRVFNFDGINTDIIYVSLYYKGEVIISKEYKMN
ncbi:MAG: hypothetical protein WBA74_09550 [Cyclobacteriaceae bacterium]